MDKTRKIGLVTWLGGPNYGTVLQSRALYEVLQSLGFDVHVIHKDSFIYGLKLKLGLKKRYPGSLTVARSAAMQSGEMKVHTFITEPGRKLFCRKMKAFVCGSDQMWNTRFQFNPDFFIGFVSGKPKIAYAPSLGCGDFDPCTTARVKELLSGFSAISVRESSGRKAVEELTGRKDVEVVLDPVFLPGKGFWASFAAGNDEHKEGGYLLCYLLRKDGSHCNMVKEVAAQYGLGSIVIVQSYENPGFTVDGATTVTGAGPKEFVSLVANAAAVLTDSFHGTAFSLIFNRPFITSKRFDDTDPASQNSRITDLLESLGLEGRMYGNDSWHDAIDWPEVNKRLAEQAEASSSYLSKALADVR